MVEKKKWYKNTTKSRIFIITFLTIFICTISIALFGLTNYPISQEKPLQKSIQKEPAKQNPTEYIVEIIQEKQPKIDPAVARPIAESVLKYSKKFEFPPELILCLIFRESSFKPMLVAKPTKYSELGCWGLMQINPPAHPEKLKKLGIEGTQVFHIDNNIHLGCMILREYYNETKSINKALTKYVGGKHPSYVCDILSDFTNLILSKKKL